MNGLGGGRGAGPIDRTSRIKRQEKERGEKERGLERKRKKEPGVGKEVEASKGRCRL